MLPRAEVAPERLKMARPSYRSFAAEVESLGAVWSNTAVTQDVWQDLGPFGASESRPFKVQNGAMVGIAKPGEKKRDGIPRAAHEKIVSDLAFLLALPVPPVILWDRGETPQERFVSISAWAFSPALSWDQAFRSLNEKHKAEASEVVSAMLAFETWISAQDRKSDHLLVDVTAEDGIQLAFIDYAYSLSMSWPVPNAAVGVSGQYVPVPKHEGAIHGVTDSILNLDDETIKKIVNRVSADYLSPDKASIIAANLLSRKTTLRGILGVN
jgi:hypothetical protein